MRLETVEKQKEIYEINIAMRILEDMKYLCMFCEFKCIRKNELHTHTRLNYIIIL